MLCGDGPSQYHNGNEVDNTAGSVGGLVSWMEESQDQSKDSSARCSRRVDVFGCSRGHQEG